MASAMKQTITLMLLMAACIGTAKAATYIVGDKTGWTIPTSASFYPNWAAKQTFQVGDTLVFNFPKGAHTVGEVSKASFDSCSTNNVISAVKATAPANYTLSSAGTHYFICTIIGHCSAGQKLAVTVTGPSSAPATAPSTSPAPSPAKSTPTPSTSPAPSPAKSTPTPSAAPAPSPAKSTTPSTSPAPSPASTTSPPPAPASPAPGGGASPPSGGAAGVPPASSPSGGAPPSDNFAAPIAGGFSLLSLVSMIVLALLF